MQSQILELDEFVENLEKGTADFDRLFSLFRQLSKKDKNWKREMEESPVTRIQNALLLGLGKVEQKRGLTAIQQLYDTFGTMMQSLTAEQKDCKKINPVIQALGHLRLAIFNQFASHIRQ